jgi:hypothetical protein
MVMKAHSEVVTDEEVTNEKEMPSREGGSDDYVKYPVVERGVCSETSMNWKLRWEI